MRFPVAATFVAIFLSAVGRVSAAANDSKQLAVADFSGLDGLQKYASEHVSPKLKELMRDRGLALWAYSTDFEAKKNNYCFASVGVTHAEVQQRNARKPVYTTEMYRRVKHEEWDAWACRSQAMRDAIESLNAAPLDEVMMNLASTQASAGKRVQQKADTSQVSLNSTGLSPAAKDAVFDVLHGYKLADVFDYRSVVTHVVSSTTTFDDGERVCVAIAGLAAAPPEDRQPRWPAATTAVISFNQSSECSGKTAISAVEGLFDRPWTAKGILGDLQRTREDGVRLPDATAIARKRAALLAQKKPRQTRSVSTQHNVLSCTNKCVNGSCLRTFDDGRQEKWQAPREFNAATGNWEWNVNSCGG